MIGKYYENDLSWDADTASQDVLTFMRLDWERTGQRALFPNQGRHLFFLWPFEQEVELLMNLEDFHFEHQIASYENLLFHDLDPDAGLSLFH